MSMNVRGKIEAAKMKVSIDGKITERFIDYIEIAEDTDMQKKVPVLFYNEKILEIDGSDIPVIIKI